MFTLITQLLRRHGAARGLVQFQQTPEYLEALEHWPDVANSLSLQFQNPRAEEAAFRLERIILDSPHPHRKSWSDVAVPTLVLGNRSDPIHPFEYATDLAGAILGAEFCEITSKAVSVDRHNADVQRCLDDFLQRRFLAGS